MRPSGLEPPPGLPRTRPSTLRVYQFRHERRTAEYRGRRRVQGGVGAVTACIRPHGTVCCEHMFVEVPVEVPIEVPIEVPNQPDQGVEQAWI